MFRANFISFKLDRLFFDTIQIFEILDSAWPIQFFEILDIAEELNRGAIRRC